MPGLRSQLLHNFQGHGLLRLRIKVGANVRLDHVPIRVDVLSKGIIKTLANSGALILRERFIHLANNSLSTA